MPVQQHNVFTAPDDPSIPIWRYMDFTKFVSMLENEGLFFSRADKLGDPFEGSFSKANEALRHILYKAPKTGEPRSLKVLSDFSRWVRQWTMVNCWHMNRHESAGMWKLYARTNEAVAVTSSYSLLCDCLDDKCFVGTVKYIDYEGEWMPEGNSFFPFVYKRLSFAHEQELRAVIQELPTKDGKIDYSATPPVSGVWKPVDLHRLVERVYVAPTSPEWYKELVGRMLLRYGLDKQVIQSSLDDAEPFY